MTSEVRILHCPLVPGVPVQPVAYWQARLALIAQSAEHTLGKGEVMGSNLIEGSIVAKIFSINI
jgi:hypothetical protein